MKQTLILDFMGIVADVDYIKLLSAMPLKQKFSALRVLVALKKSPEIKKAFKQYQLGQIDSQQLQDVVAIKYPNSAYVVPLLLEALSQHIQVDEDVLELVKDLQEHGVQMLLMSNTIPETERVIKNANLHEIFDGVILSTELGMAKPNADIYEYAITQFDLAPETTSMIDDKKQNLVAAEKFGITPIKCNSTKDTVDALKIHLTALELAD